MFDDKKDDIFLSRWINGELTKEELIAFKSHPEYEHYVKIMAGADALYLKEYNEEKALIALKSKRSSTSKKSGAVIKLWPYVAAAASIAIILGLFLFSSNQTFTSSYGEQLAITLPDGSEMILNAKSKASFNKNNWEGSRSITLEGEAYFKVKKGSKFTVITENGEVSVLGTQFNVYAQDAFFEVHCFEGKVSVVNNKYQEILTAGKAFRDLDNTTPESWTIKAQQPSWITNSSTFRSIPLQYVFNELEKQYNIKIQSPSIDLKTIYTGTFPNNNKKVALRTVFGTLGFEYSLSPDGKTVVLEK